VWSYQPPFAFEPSPELRIWDGSQQTDHRDRYCALTNKVYLPLKDVIGIVIKADDEPPNTSIP
jgi:hypothetical protein